VLAKILNSKGLLLKILIPKDLAERYLLFKDLLLIRNMITELKIAVKGIRPRLPDQGRGRSGKKFPASSGGRD
jgi:hypothetical protein